MFEDFKYEKLTPMLKHFCDVKENFKDAILLYRVGDFYETFFDDAIITSKVLQLALTGKDCGHDRRAPMCGVPHHVVDNYVSKLVKNGYKVAICDQVEDPKEAKGLVKRAITRVVSPGTLTDMDSLDKKENNYLASIYFDKFGLSVSYSDISTGKLVSFEIKATNKLLTSKALDQVEKISPSEVILNRGFSNQEILDYLDFNHILINYIDDGDKDSYFAENIKSRLGEGNFQKIGYDKLSQKSLSNLLDYIYSFHEENLDHLNDLEVLEINNYMELGAATMKNLELTKSLATNGRDNTLLNILDKADTVMGSRLISDWLERPLIDKKEIDKRLDIVDYFVKNRNLSDTVSLYLSDVYDLERLIGKISYKRANARDFISLKNSLENIPKLKAFLISLPDRNLSTLGMAMPDVGDTFDLIDSSIVDDPPIQITEGEIIKAGFSRDLDDLKRDAASAKDDLLTYEKEERDRLDIKNYRISYNKNAGYSIEITKSNLDKVPDDYIRKQTLKNVERYTTERLEKLSTLILGSSDKINDLEYEIFQDIRGRVLEETTDLQLLAKLISILDALNSFSKVAVENSYVRPQIRDDKLIKIKGGRHPVIEKNLKENEFIANDTDIGEDDNLIQIITGPNMAGKSTYMRQTAIIIIMAQIGSFVPADSCSLSICDKVFTRIGASDNIAKGESTFMLEMKEVSNILANATENSFIILDEVGRGTGSDDGLSIATSLVTYLSKNKRAKTVFATHFHELTDLEGKLSNVKNLKIDILEENGRLIFLRKIKPGKSDRSYGIEVAKMAGLPQEIIENAKLFMETLDEDKRVYEDSTPLIRTVDKLGEGKLKDLKSEVSGLDINSLTPLESINKLSHLVEKIKEL